MLPECLVSMVMKTANRIILQVVLDNANRVNSDGVLVFHFFFLYQYLMLLECLVSVVMQTAVFLQVVLDNAIMPMDIIVMGIF